MAIFEKDGFEFIDDIYGDSGALIVKGENLTNEIKYINDNNIKSVYVTFFKSKGIVNFDFLKEVKLIEKVNINDVDVDYTGLYNLNNLKVAILSIKNKKQHLDYSKFKHLESLSIDWYTKFPDLTNNKELKELVIWKFKPTSKRLSELKLPSDLENLQLSESNILNFNGIFLANLKRIECHYCSSLESLEGIKGLSTSLNTIILDYCKKLSDYSDIATCKQLKKIILGDCGDISTLNWLESLKNVNHFSFWNTRLIDGNTNPCFGIDYVSFKNAEHYNHKIEEFK